MSPLDIAQQVAGVIDESFEHGESIADAAGTPGRPRTPASPRDNAAAGNRG